VCAESTDQAGPLPTSNIKWAVRHGTQGFGVNLKQIRMRTLHDALAFVFDFFFFHVKIKAFFTLHAKKFIFACRYIVYFKLVKKVNK
jgi:hypothetical protein